MSSTPIVERRATERRSVERRSVERRSFERRGLDRRRPHAPQVERRHHHQATPTALPHRAFAAVTYRNVTQSHVGHDWLFSLLDFLINPLALVAALFTVTLAVHGKISAQHLLLALVVFTLTFRGHLHLTITIPGVARHILAGWIAVSGLLLLLGWATGTLGYFDRTLLIAWWCAAPVFQFAAQVLLRSTRPKLARLLGPPAEAVVVGINEQGLELAQRIEKLSTYIRVVGFFDDRPDQALKGKHHYPILGKLNELANYVNQNKTKLIYISLPMVNQPRIEALLEGLRDTTASIYFVPNIFFTDLIQGRVDSINGLPVVAICETPFMGLDGLLKRASDIAFSLFTLILFSPLLLLIALGVKMSSPGPVLFRQRRYGLDGKMIVVYKFRSMTVTEDGATIQQAARNDARVTNFGAFLRRTSMDELPQLVNVLQGRMSVVGPRPHAVAHNEMYRKLISGYMLRHKVRPGITGWAQVNGLRGETDTLQKMKERVIYDLDYLRNWSLKFDAYIVAKTLWVVLRGDNAY